MDNITLKSEPAVIVGTITAFVTAAIGLLVAYGLDITEEQKNAVLSMTAVLAPVIAAVIIRGKVFAPDTVRDIVHDAYDPMDPATWKSPPPPEPIRGRNVGPTV